jgi:hypothetical protein
MVPHVSGFRRMRPRRKAADIGNIAQNRWMVFAMTMVIEIVMTDSEGIVKALCPCSLREKVEAVYLCKDPVRALCKRVEVSLRAALETR